MISKISQSSAELIAAASNDFERLAQSLLAKKQRLRVLLTGGSLGIEFIAALAKLNLDYSRIWLMFSDERFVPLDHPDRNEYQGITRWPELSDYLTRFPDSNRSLAQARNELEADLTPVFESEDRIDLTILGMGPDGHVASLFPGHQQPGKWVIAEDNSPKPPSQRLSLSYQALNQSDRVWFLASGAEKAWAVREGMKPNSVPASKVRGSLETVWYLDQTLSDEL